MKKSLRTSSRQWSAGLLAVGSLAFAHFQAPTAEANSLYWRRYEPTHIGPGPVFIGPTGTIWNGGWWISVDTGPQPLSLCRISDGHSWAYGNYADGLCGFYSPTFNRGLSIRTGFDLMGGIRFPSWGPLSGGHVHPHPLQEKAINILGSVTGAQQQAVLNSELSTLCRIRNDEGAFIGIQLEGHCFASWKDKTLISSNFEVINGEEP
jgi:hypothetical protein